VLHISPYASLSCLAYTPLEYVDGSSELRSELVEKYKVMFIKVHQWEKFQYSDIALNNIYAYNGTNTAPAPDFVTNFERMLDTKPGLRPGIPCSLDTRSRAVYFELREDSTVEDESYEEAQQPLRYADKLEVLHITYIASYDWEILWDRPGDGKRAWKKCFGERDVLPVLMCSDEQSDLRS
jgi:hypothetical protein